MSAHTCTFGPGGLRCRCGAWHPEISQQEIDRLRQVDRALDAVGRSARAMAAATPMPVHHGPQPTLVLPHGALWDHGPHGGD